LFQAAQAVSTFAATKKPGAVTRPGFRRTFGGYLFVLESRYVVKIFFPVFFPSSIPRRIFFGANYRQVSVQKERLLGMAVYKTASNKRSTQNLIFATCDA
jgi:hypothetical protein